MLHYKELFTVYIVYWADQGHYTMIKIGKLVRIHRLEFEDWLNYREKNGVNS